MSQNLPPGQADRPDHPEDTSRTQPVLSRQCIRFAYPDIAPAPRSVLVAQGIPQQVEPDARVVGLLEEALSQLRELVEPLGVMQEVTLPEFDRIYPGEGLNAPASPLAQIYPQAEVLALFAVTLGAPVCRRIAELFDVHDYALASLLDAAASEAADLTAAALEKIFADTFRMYGKLRPDAVALRYSPGYCGWHVSGQKALFARLNPYEIEVSLRESCLMEPLKSVSGVVVGGPRQIHEFEPGYPFCADCSDFGCRERIRNI